MWVYGECGLKKELFTNGLIRTNKRERERGERGKGGFSKRCRKKVMEEEKIEEIKEHTIFKYLPNLII